MAEKRKIFLGAFVHSKTPTELEIVENGAIGVNEAGVIKFVERDVKSLDEVKGTADGSWSGAAVVTVKKGNWLFPGFIDTHIHASQYPNTGIFGKSTLLDWLNTYTFPLESSLSSLPLARRVYSRVVARTLAHGTTTAAYYATIHVPATNLLADICLARGQRALVGRVCMNQLSPSYYRDESVDDAIKASRACIDHARTIDAEGALVRPVITPRFAPSCSMECMQALAQLQRETGAWAQTHISENKPEIELVAREFPQCKHYTGVYDDAGLLSERMILAHAVHLSPEEQELVKEKGAKISHCPASNTALTSGRCPVRDFLEKGIDVGLGTDVSGGFSASILEMVRQAVWVSRHVAMSEGDRYKLSTEEALYLATRGGAKVVGLADTVGGFEVGMEFDAQLVGFDVQGKGKDEEVDDEELKAFVEKEGPVDVFGWESWENRVNKWVYNGDDRNTFAVWVKGKLVHARKEYEA